MVQWFRYRTYHSGIHVACSLILTKLLFFLCRWIRFVKISKVLSFSFRLLSKIVVHRAMWVVYVFLLWYYFSHIYQPINFYFRYRCSVLDKVPGSAIPKQDLLETTKQGHRVVSSLARLHCNHYFTIDKCSFCFPLQVGVGSLDQPSP